VRYTELRSLAAKNRRTVEATVKELASRAQGARPMIDDAIANRNGRRNDPGFQQLLAGTEHIGP